MCYFDARVSLLVGKVNVVELADALVSDLIRPGDAVADLPPGMDVGAIIPVPVHLRADGEIHGSYAYCEVDGRLRTGILHPAVDGGSAYYSTCYLDAMVTVEAGRVRAVKAEDAAVKDQIRAEDPIARLPEGLEASSTIPVPVYVNDDGAIRYGYSFCEEVQ